MKKTMITIKKYFVVLLILFVFVLAALSQEKAKDKSYFPVLTGLYLGQEPPGMTPKIFAPGIVSTDSTEFACTFSPDGKELYFTRYGGNLAQATIMFMQQENGLWSQPQIAPFSGQYNDVDPMFSPDGNRLYFSSNRPLEKSSSQAKDYDIWVVKRTNKGWSDSESLGHPVNSDRDEYYPSIAVNGTLYFPSGREGGLGGMDYYRSIRKGGAYLEPENLGNAINTKHREGDGFIAPDESYFLFSAFLPNNFGDGDLYISFQKEDGKWTKAKNMGEMFNSKGNEFTPLLSPDGKFFFFASNRNGSDDTDIYWVDAKAIQKIINAGTFYPLNAPTPRLCRYSAFEVDKTASYVVPRICGKLGE